MKRLLVFCLVALASCGGGDWQAGAVEAGEQSIRQDVNDPSVRFFKVQAVGNSSTGQICGEVLGKDVSTGFGGPVRFVGYIDGTAGPWIEGQHGHNQIPDARFEFAWANDCVAEGWKG